MTTLPRQQVLRFRRRIRAWYRCRRRDLPFRNTIDPYRITVSEIMLQQTQVSRGVPKYEAWIRRWPDWQSLARASNRELLAMWSGLGYNRRALYLGQLARTVMEQYGGELPNDAGELESLPGIGPYTSRAIQIFAFNKSVVAIDTNIRRVILQEFGLPASIGRAELEHIARQLLPRGDARNWHYALMDYSALALPRRLSNVPARTIQGPFKGSMRQIRGEIIRQLTTKHSVRLSTVAKRLGCDPAAVRRAAEALAKEGVVRLSETTVRLA
jgi:A/G-specific adenine glycosylase